jgi:hypothetical protein
MHHQDREPSVLPLGGQGTVTRNQQRDRQHEHDHERQVEAPEQESARILELVGSERAAAPAGIDLEVVRQQIRLPDRERGKQAGRLDRVSPDESVREAACVRRIAPPAARGRLLS